MRNNILRHLWLVPCFALFFTMGAAFHKYGGFSAARAIFRSPVAYLRVHGREWNSFELTRYTQDNERVVLRRYIETGLLPLIIDGKRLSDFYPVPKFGGAITLVNKWVVILDRLGGLYRYDLTSGSFALLRIPSLPNNLQAYLQHPELRTANGNDEFRAHDIIFLPDRKELAAAYDKFDPALRKLRTSVSIIPIDPTTLASQGAWQQIFVSDPYEPGAASESGGRMAYRGDGTLYLALGAHYITEPKISQDPNTTFGKIIEIDLATSSWRVFSKGHRNPEGLAFLENGQLLATDQGPMGGDELNVITQGNNYGWPNVTLGTEYDSYSWPGAPTVGSDAGYPAPLFAWVPDIAVSQLVEVNNFNPRWNGDLLVGSLKASSLYRLRLEAGRVIYSEQIWIGQRIRDIAQTKDGTIILWTDDTQLMFLKVDADQLALNWRYPAGVNRATVDRCMACHHFGPTNPDDPGPSLSNLLNRRIASDTFRYSPGLRAKQGNWTKARLFEFLSDPSKFANGTNMPNLGLSPGQLNDIIDTLVRVSASPASAKAAQ